MLQVFTSLLALLGSVGLLTVATGLLGTLIGVRMTLEGVPAEVTGWVTAAYFAGLMGGALVVGRVISRVGHIRAFSVCAAGATAAVLLQALWVSPPGWMLLRALTGLCVAGLYMVIESWLNERADNSNRGRVFSLYQLTNFAGLGLGQLLLQVGEAGSGEMFMLAALVLAISLIPVCLTTAGHPLAPQRPAMAWREVLARAPLGAAVCLAAGLANGGVYGLAPVFALQSGLSVGGVSSFMGAIIVGGLLLQWPIGHWSDRFGRRRVVLLVGLGLLVIAVLLWSLLTALGSPGLPVLMAFGLALGGLSFTLYPLAVAHANDSLSGCDFVGVSAALLFTWGIGAVAGPIAAGALMTAVGPAGLFLFLGAVAVGVVALALLRPREALAEDAQEPFRTMARTTPVIAELDPRGAEAPGQP